MIQIGRSQVTCSASKSDLTALRALFETRHYIQISSFLEPGLLQFIQQQIERGEFYERVHEGIGSNKELCLKGNTAVGALLLLMNDENLFQIIQEITQCIQIRCFEGRVYRESAGQGHHDSWHDDVGEDRLVGMSINLSEKDYAGGMLQIRERGSQKIIAEVHNSGPGNALIFRLSKKLQHRRSEVAGTAPKTAFAGWFRASGNLLSLRPASG